MNTIQLECFLAVVDSLNFTKAAEAVQLTQPAISHQIQTLENELGTPLFLRTSKRVELTKAGMQFISDASQILRIASSAKARLSDYEGKDMLFLEIGCHSQYELAFLPPILRRLIQEFPNLHPSFRLLPFRSLDNLLENDSIQAMFDFKTNRKPIGTYQELYKCPLVCVCNAEHPLAGRTSLTESELTGNFIAGDPSKGPEAVLPIQSRIVLSRPASQVYFADGYESVVALIRSGIGFTVFPDLPASRDAGLCYIPIPSLGWISFGIYYKSLKGKPVLKRFFQILVENFRSFPSNGDSI